MSRVLVTGASGFIGQHLSLALVESGWDVRCISRSSRPPILQDVEWRSGDILDDDFVARAVAGSNIVIHLACLPLGQSARDPVLASRVNTEGMLRILDAGRRVGVERFLFTSTSQIYGGRSLLPNKESDLPHPESAYAASKLSAEMWCDAYRQMYQLPVQILRLFNVYGLAADGKPRPTVETIFMQQIRNGHRPRVVGDPQTGRDFIYIDDVLKAVQIALVSPIWEGSLNIGTGILTTITELALLVARVMGETMEPELVFNDEPVARLQADTNQAKLKLGFQATVDLENGLRRILQASENEY
jgi:UDP-glucose 4-epimerase